MSDDSQSKPDIILRTSTLNDSVQCSVEDYGIGTAEQILDRLFDPFYTSKSGGTGMGLAINRTIIHAHGGCIWATRNASRGMTFHFSLPIIRGNST
jgi:signal transduction histidine kinase